MGEKSADEKSLGENWVDGMLVEESVGEKYMGETYV